MAEVSSPVEVLRAAADRLDELAAAAEWEAWRGAQDHADMAWIEAMSPQAAPALSAWLQTTASMLTERLDALDRNPGQYQGAAQVHAAALARLHGFYEPALRFAGLVLGLPAVSDTTGEGHRG